MPHTPPSGERSELQSPASVPTTHTREARPTDVFSGFVPPILPKKGQRAGRAPRAEQNYGEKKRAQASAASQGVQPSTPKAPKVQKPADPLHGYVPLDRLTYIGTQVCPDCARTTRYIAGDLIRFQHTHTGGRQTLRTRAYAAVDSRTFTLPRSVEYLTPETCTCAECLSMSLTFDVAADGRGQLPLQLSEGHQNV